MATMNVSLPESLRSFIDERVNQDQYGSASEYVRDLVRQDRDRQRLRALLTEGATSASGPTVDAEYVEHLRGIASR